MVDSRPYERESDLRLLQELCAETWRRLGPLAPVHVGDVAWWMYQRPNRLADATVQLWLENRACVAFAWNWLSKGDLDFVVHPERTELIDDVLEWADAPRVFTQESDVEKIARLEARGYRPLEGEASNHMVLALDVDVREPTVPAGYRLRTVRRGDLERRVAVHRAAFAPSRVVPASYARLQQEWPYRPDLDHVVEGSDGSFAAFCLAWIDAENRAGLLEPVGTHPEHRRRGLATAVCSAAALHLRALGAEHVVIGSIDGSDAERLYERIGFRTVTRHVPYGKKSADEVV
jgi:ribosomal protein S18 acetylase RimI-like enzyme